MDKTSLSHIRSLFYILCWDYRIYVYNLYIKPFLPHNVIVILIKKKPDMNPIINKTGSRFDSEEKTRTRKKETGFGLGSQETDT